MTDTQPETTTPPATVPPKTEQPKVVNKEPVESSDDIIPKNSDEATECPECKCKDLTQCKGYLTCNNCGHNF